MTLYKTQQVKKKKNQTNNEEKRMPSNAQLGTSELNTGKVLLWTKAILHLKCNT